MAEATKAKTFTTHWGVEIDEAHLPPMEPYVLAAYRRMWTDPDVFAGYDPDAWVAFEGENIVAASTDLAELHRILDGMGKREVRSALGAGRAGRPLRRLANSRPLLPLASAVQDRN